MTIDITQIPFSEIGKNSILVIRLSPETVQKDTLQVEQLADLIRTKTDKSVQILVVSSGTDVLHVSEDTMNSAGWYRRESTPTPTPSP